MANEFDKFDSAPAPQKNAFDQFDAQSEAVSPNVFDRVDEQFPAANTAADQAKIERFGEIRPVREIGTFDRFMNWLGGYGDQALRKQQELESFRTQLPSIARQAAQSGGGTAGIGDIAASLFNKPEAIPGIAPEVPSDPAAKRAFSAKLLLAINPSMAGNPVIQDVAAGAYREAMPLINSMESAGGALSFTPVGPAFGLAMAPSIAKGEATSAVDLYHAIKRGENAEELGALGARTAGGAAILAAMGLGGARMARGRMPVPVEEAPPIIKPPVMESVMPKVEAVVSKAETEGIGTPERLNAEVNKIASPEAVEAAPHPDIEAIRIQANKAKADAIKAAVETPGVSYRYSVQPAQEFQGIKIPEVIQVDAYAPDGTNIVSSNVKDLKAAGAKLPDVPKGVPLGQYTTEQIAALTKPSAIEPTTGQPIPAIKGVTPKTVEKGIRVEANDHPEVAAKAPELLPEIVKDELKIDKNAYSGDKDPNPQPAQPNANQKQGAVEVPSGETPGTPAQVAAREPGNVQEPTSVKSEGVGGAPQPEQVAPVSAEAAFTQELSRLAPGKRPPIMPPPKIGIAAPGFGDMGRALVGARDALTVRIKGMIDEIANVPRFTPFKKAVNDWFGARQLSSLAIRDMASGIERVVPGRVAREAIINYMQAGGDVGVLKMWHDLSTNAARKLAYKRAMELTPEQIAIADQAKAYYAEKLKLGQKWDVLDEGLENYVNQVWKRPFVGGGPGGAFTGKMSQMFKFARSRVFGSYFEGEAMDMIPANKDIAATTALYGDALDKVIATKQFIKDLTSRKASDGRPLAAPVGSAEVLGNRTGDPADPILINPTSRGEANADYQTLNNAALSKWKWVAQDEDGSPILMRGQLGLHPEIYHHVKNILTRSAIREWYDEPGGASAMLAKSAVKAIDVMGQGTKRTMLGFLSPFHQVQEGTHAVGHRINPFFGLPDLDPASPNLARAVKHGLAIAGDNEAMQFFMEGLGGNKNLMWNIPLVGKWAQDYSTYLFHSYIPRLKYQTYLHIEDRNMARYADQIKTGNVSADDVQYLSAQQTNAAYGHLNYADMGRNPTFQHVLQMIMLAPDFLEARGRFAAQAAKGLIPTKGKGEGVKLSLSGREQTLAIATLAATFWITARIGNKLLDDDYHWDHPFELKVGNRSYAMRNVPEDTWNAFKNTRQFIYSRMSPIVGRGTIEGLTGRNYRGEKITPMDEARELATRWIPIGLASTPAVRELTATGRVDPVKWWEQFMGTMGAHIKRTSPNEDVYDLANEWKKKVGVTEDTGTYPESKYLTLRYALEDNDTARAQNALSELLKVSSPMKVQQGFRASVMRPWTGTQTSDAAFMKSLSPDDRAKVEKANRFRLDVYKRFGQLKFQPSSPAKIGEPLE